MRFHGKLDEQCQLAQSESTPRRGAPGDARSHAAETVLCLEFALRELFLASSRASSSSCSTSSLLLIKTSSLYRELLGVLAWLLMETSHHLYWRWYRRYSQHCCAEYAMVLTEVVAAPIIFILDFNVLSKCCVVTVSRRPVLSLKWHPRNRTARNAHSQAQQDD